MSKRTTILQLFKFLNQQKKYWLYPIIIVFVLLGILIVLGESSVIAPFIYTLF